MANIRTHYDNLRVARNAPDSVIKAAYKALCQTYHPDKFQGSNAEAERIMKLINASYVVLIDPVKRAEHDAWIQAQETEANQPREKATFGETGNGTEQEFYQKQETKWKYTPPPTEPEPPEADTSPHEWRRYFARLIDYFICALLLSFILAAWSATGQSLPNAINAAINNPNLSSAEQTGVGTLVVMFLWVTLEPICLSMFGTTIGKALFRLRLVSNDSKPNYWGRSIAVWLLGMGGGLPVISLFCMLNAAAKLKKNGQTEWDRRTGFSVEAEPLSILRGVSLTVLIMLMFIVGAVLGEIGKHTIPSKQPIQQAQVVKSVPQAFLDAPYVAPDTKSDKKVDISSYLDKPYDGSNGYVTSAPAQNVQQAKPSNTMGAYDKAMACPVATQEATPQEYQYARNLCLQGRYAEALPLYQGLAEQGNAWSQYGLGCMYEFVDKDYQKAAEWYHKAAEQGHAYAIAALSRLAEQGNTFAQFSLGSMYETGLGVTQDYTQAISWYHKAAERGYVGAQFNLGIMYNFGKGVVQDYSQAVYWYNKAAEQGDIAAQSNLGFMYSNGHGVAQNYAQAVYWYRKAVEQGDAQAQFNLAGMYITGHGVTQDYNQAVYWYRKSAEQGYASAIAALKKLGQ